MLKKKRIKILARRNLQMSPGKLAAQSVHAVLGLAAVHNMHNTAHGKTILENLVEMSGLTCVVLEVSNQKFYKQIGEATAPVFIFSDAGYTEVEPMTVTCAAFLEDDPKAKERKADSVHCCDLDEAGNHLKGCRHYDG